MTGFDKPWKEITPKDVESFQSATPKFLCPLSANIYDIQFTAFQITDLGPDGNSHHTLFKVARDPNEVPPVIPPEHEDLVRTIKYNFSPKFLELKFVRTCLEFTIGDKAVTNFLMIERHYFRNKLIKSYTFKSPYCIANTKNTWTIDYELPELDEITKKEMIEKPWETQSDSFYFVDDKLIIHNKAYYAYTAKN